MNKINLSIFPLMALLLLCSCISGCSSSSVTESINLENGNTTITIKNELGSYSLEYPAPYEHEIIEDFSFRIPYSDLILQSPETTLGTFVINSTSERVQTISVPIDISVIHVRMSKSPTSASDRINMLLESESSWNNFKIIDRTTLNISDIKAEKVTFVSDKFAPILPQGEENLWYCCDIYFEGYGLLWNIEVKCDMNIKEIVQVEFDHIVESFKILD